MDCLRCGREHEFDRLAVERATGEVLGSYCEDCEGDLVARATETTSLSMTTCLVCGDEAAILFPKWDTLVQDDDGVVAVEYTVALDTPGCCRDCATPDDAVVSERRRGEVSSD